MINLRRFSHSIPACDVLDALDVSAAEIMGRLGLTHQLWYLWRSGLRKPSQKSVWGLTLLAQEALSEAEKTSLASLSDASQSQLKLLLQYARELLTLQSNINLSLSPAAKAAAQFQLRQTTSQQVVTSQSI